MGASNKESGKLKKNALDHMFVLLTDVNRDIEISKGMNSPGMVRQYERLKRQYTKDFLDLLAIYDLPIVMTEAATQPVEQPQAEAA